MSCIVTKGDEPLKISWAFHGHELSEGLGIITSPLGTRGSSLMIPSVGHEHRGNYTCQAVNSAGKREKTVELKVNGMGKVVCNVTGRLLSLLLQLSILPAGCHSFCLHTAWTAFCTGMITTKFTHAMRHLAASLAILGLLQHCVKWFGSGMMNLLVMDESTKQMD